MNTEYPDEFQDLLNDLRCVVANICYLYLIFFECHPYEFNKTNIIGYCSHMRRAENDMRDILDGLERLTVT